MSFIPIPDSGGGGGGGGVYVQAGDGITSTGTGSQADPLIFSISSSTKGFVNHGATAGTARPVGYASVEWYGSVTPTNAINGDTWIDTSA